MPFRRTSFPALLAAGALATATLVAPVAFAQATPEVPAASPAAKVEQRVGITDFSVSYASPGVKGRKIFGALVPFDELWRAGANNATVLTASREFTFGGKKVPAGSYTLLAIPGKSSWTVVLNTDTKLWGTYGYDQKKDVARVSVKPDTIPARERLTFLFSDTTDDATRLDLEWDKVRVSVPVKVETNAHVLAGIDASVNEAWRPHYVSARYLLESNGDLDRALELVNASIASKGTWSNNWVKAQILAKKGRKSDAVKAAKAAQTAGKGDRVYEGFYKGTIEKAIGDWK